MALINSNSSSPARPVIEADLSRVRQIIAAQLAPDCGYDIVRHIDSTNGKMLRPVMLLLSARCFGEPLPMHYDLAAIIELIHCVTLVHDDVIDESQLRRGKDSANKLFGNRSAVLAGDLLFARVFKMCTAITDPAVSALLADTTLRLCRGELDQSSHRGNWNISENQYLDIISLKSASLISTSCFLGSLVAGDQESSKALADFGTNIGMAFQLADDILDFTSEQARLGKPVGSDLSQCTVTLPMIHYLSAQTEKASAAAELIALADNRLRLARLNGSIQYSRDFLDRYYQKAVDALSPIPGCMAKSALLEIADNIRASARC